MGVYSRGEREDEMALKQLITGETGVGKSIYTLSMAALGDIAIADVEYAYDWYVTPIASTGEGKKVIKCHINEDVKALAGITGEPIVHLLQSQDIGLVQRFITASATLDNLVGIGVDGGSVVWDMASDLVDESMVGGLKWNDAKRFMRRFTYDALKTQKHYILTTHLQTLYDKNMKIIGEKPWVEKKTPHWVDFGGKLVRTAEENVPSLVVFKERSAGRVKMGTTILSPTVSKVLQLFKNIPIPLGVRELDDVEYRSGAAVSALKVNGDGK